jgi:hypothetical protein
LRWQFVLGILLAALGGYLVTQFKPDTAGAKDGATKPAIQAREIK